jgi:hypothetical protein
VNDNWHTYPSLYAPRYMQIGIWYNV